MTLQPFSRRHQRSLWPLFPRVGFLPSQHQLRVHLTTTPDHIATTLTPCRFFSLISRHSDPFCWHALFLFVCFCKDWVQVSRLASCFACTIRGLRMANIYLGRSTWNPHFQRSLLRSKSPCVGWDQLRVRVPLSFASQSKSFKMTKYKPPDLRNKRQMTTLGDYRTPDGLLGFSNVWNPSCFIATPILVVFSHGGVAPNHLFKDHMTSHRK